ncbi:MAG: amino acid ABC transporter permease [Erysipelotrichaceae bacterium]|nr:amino acid ABC transporter permease [Erysipelotrichaceae bacterium]MDY5252092.1 amino acid ABC transporter permease [Erysipelotrichaceae bacterium]
MGSSQTILEVFINNYQLFFQGLMGTLQLAFITVLFGTILGSLIAFIRLSNSKILNFIVGAYVEIIRGTPILVQLYIFYLFLPMTFSALSNVSEYWFVVGALIMNSSAYVSEIIRAGIQAVDHGQSEAARSLGMSKKNTMLRIVLPQAIKNILPALGNEFIMMIKETSLASVFFINELMCTQKILQSSQFLVWQPLFIVAAIYFVVTYGLNQLVKLLERRLSVSD